MPWPYPFKIRWVDGLVRLMEEIGWLDYDKDGCFILVQLSQTCWIRRSEKRGGVNFLKAFSNYGKVRKVRMASLWSCERKSCCQFPFLLPKCVGHEGMWKGRDDDDVCKDGGRCCGHHEKLTEVGMKGG